MCTFYIYTKQPPNRFNIPRLCGARLHTKDSPTYNHIHYSVYTYDTNRIIAAELRLAVAGAQCTAVVVFVAAAVVVLRELCLCVLSRFGRQPVASEFSGFPAYARCQQSTQSVREFISTFYVLYVCCLCYVLCS